MSARHTFTIPADVQDVLRQSSIEVDRVILPGQLDRKLYTSTMKVLTEYGGTWNKKAGAILLKAGGREKLLDALGTGVVQREKVIRQAFYTPEPVANGLCFFASEWLTDSDEPLRMLEPSAGAGALIKAARTFFGARLVWPVSAIEIDTEAADELATELGIPVQLDDFLQCVPPRSSRFDLILQNPPFQKGQALKHFKHALSFLAEGGVLAAILPLNFPVGFDGWEVESKPIPAGAFKESGTNIATKMVRARRA